MRSLLKLITLLLLSCAAAGRTCRSDEVCIREAVCIESDDSGRGLLGPRTLDNTCGLGLMCCDKEQLESFEATQAQFKAKFLKTDEPNATTVRPPEPDLKSCNGKNFCVPRHLCSSGSINEDGRFIVKPRSQLDEDFECNLFEVCCPVADRLTEEQNPLQQELQNFKYKGCGYRNLNGLYYKLVGYNDYEAHFAEFPWMVALMDMEANYVSGGTLIHPQLVLTSAHNLANHSSDSLLARAGEYDLNSQMEPHAYQSRTVRHLWRHQLFNKLNFHNDIALLVLERPFELAPHIQPLCLPPVDSAEVQQSLREAQCFAIGWGQRNDSQTEMEQILKRIDLPVLEHERCQTMFRALVLGKRFIFDKSFLCAGGVEGKDTCKGDGGSPLFCSIPGETNRFQLAGIVSWGLECAAKDIPAAYTNVPYLRAWIDEQIARTSFKLDVV